MNEITNLTASDCKLKLPNTFSFKEESLPIDTNLGWTGLLSK